MFKIVFLSMQTSFQRLALRMTRFYTNQSSSIVWSRLQQVVKKLGYESRTSPDKVRVQCNYMRVDDCAYTLNSFSVESRYPNKETYDHI